MTVLTQMAEESKNYAPINYFESTEEIKLSRGNIAEEVLLEFLL